MFFLAVFPSGLGPAQEPGTKTFFPISAVPDYRHVRPALKRLVQDRGKQPLNHFCVVGFRVGNYYAADVYWKEDQALIQWERSTDPDNPPLPLPPVTGISIAM